MLSDPWTDPVLVFDTETRVDKSQALLVGGYKLYHWQGTTLVCDEEGLFYADDLPNTSHVAYETLRNYVAQRALTSPTRLLLMSRRAFVEDVFYPAAYGARARVVGFNLPFDLSRIAEGDGIARGKRFLGGFSLQLTHHYDPGTGAAREHAFLPRVSILHRDRTSAFIEFAAPIKTDPRDRIPPDSPDGAFERRYRFRGHMLDLKTLTKAVTDEDHSLKSAAKEFKTAHAKLDAPEHGRITPEYLRYLRQDVVVTGDLLETLRAEYDRHPIGVDPSAVYSPASIAKGYLRAMGITEPATRAPHVSPRHLGIAASAYFGGRAEVRLRRVPVPVVYLDFLSMYPTVNALMGLWPLVIAEELYVEDATREVQVFLDSVTTDTVMRRETWPTLVAFAEIVPGGDVVPARAQYAGPEDAFTIGVNPLWRAAPSWYALADLVASKLLSGKTPRVRSAFWLRGRGVLASLRTVRLRSEVPVNPADDDFFRRVIEERVRAADRSDLTKLEQERLRRALKVVANSGSYGIYGEANPERLPEGKTAEVWVEAAGQRLRTRVAAPEERGEFAFMPLAALITAGARLMLALLECAIQDRGGSYVACDTDSMMPVAREHAGLIACPGGPHRLRDGREAVRALSWDEVDDIVRQFDVLKPYDPDVVRDPILKIDSVNFHKRTKERLPLECYAISAKRYALFWRNARGRPVLRDKTEGGLGHLLDPRDPANDERTTRKTWINDAWLRIVTTALGRRGADPAWLNRPALSRESLTSPVVARRLTKGTAHLPYSQRMKAFNFLLAAHVRDGAFPVGVDPQHFHLIAPFTSDARQWTKLTWTNSYDGKPYRIATSGRSSVTTAGVKSYDDVLRAFARHPEAKSLAPDGTPCGEDTVGLLRRRPVLAVRTIARGKEGYKAEEVDREEVHDIEEVQPNYGEVGPDAWTSYVLPILRELPRALLAAVAGISERSINNLWHERSMPSLKVRAALTRFAADHARGAPSVDDEADDVMACARLIISGPSCI